MTARRLALAFVAASLAACSSMPEPQETFYFDEQAMAALPSTPMVEYPPIEPVTMPPPVEPTPLPEADVPATKVAATAPTTAAQPAAAVDAAAPKAAPAPPAAQERIIVATLPPPAPAGPVVPPEDLELIAVMSDLNRYNALAADDLKRELASMTQTFNRERSDANRVRLAVLYTLTHSLQDDLRAQQLLDNVAKSGGPVTPVKHLAAVLQAQVTERTRAVRDEAARANDAQQKLEALRQMERSLLRDRVSSGGGGAGGGAGGGGH
ncbi:MAG: hypothetical protein ACHP91_14290 [Burkholderiales bacterium]